MSTIIQRTDRRHGAAEHVSAALLELTKQLIDAPSDDAACRTLAAGLKEIGGLDTVVIGLSSGGPPCRIRAVSSLMEIERNAPTIRAWNRALDESLRAADTPPGIEAEAAATHDGTNDRPWCVPIRSRAGRAIGVCGIVFVPGETQEPRPLVRTAIEVLGPIFEVALATRQRPGFGSAWRSLRGLVSGRRRAVAVLGAITVSLFMPLPLPVRCDCELQPEVRRSVAAPFAAIWRKSHVRPGDLVEAGQSLGLLDSAELQKELTAATAERDRAAKSADVHAAAGKTAAAQIDRLEVRRIDERRALLAARVANVDVKSPLAGIVISGDLDRAEGAPIKQGMELFEIAPLDRITVEVLVPEADLDRMQVGATANLVLDAQPYEDYAGTISRIRPRAEIRDEVNVFVAEIVIENPAGQLRPGMKGSARIAIEPRSAATMIADLFRPTLNRLMW